MIVCLSRLELLFPMWAFIYLSLGGFVETLMVPAPAFTFPAADFASLKHLLQGGGGEHPQAILGLNTIQGTSTDRQEGNLIGLF